MGVYSCRPVVFDHILDLLLNGSHGQKQARGGICSQLVRMNRIETSHKTSSCGLVEEVGNMQSEPVV
jgi:hypothetical protein